MTQVAIAWSLGKECKRRTTWYSYVLNLLGVRALVINAPATDQLLNALGGIIFSLFIFLIRNTFYVGGMDLVLTAGEIQYLEEPYNSQNLRH